MIDVDQTGLVGTSAHPCAAEADVNLAVWLLQRQQPPPARDVAAGVRVGARGGEQQSRPHSRPALHGVTRVAEGRDSPAAAAGAIGQRLVDAGLDAVRNRDESQRPARGSGGLIWH